MTGLRAWLWSVRVQIVLGATMAPLLTFFLVMSSNTGRDEYEAAEETLTRMEALDLQLNGTIFPLLFEFQMDFDELTRIQTEFYETAAAYDASRSSDASNRLFGMIREKNTLIDDFKAHQAVIRNSRAIAEEMLQNAWDRPAIAEAGAETDLFAVERNFLDFIGRRDPPSIERLRASIAEIESSSSVLADVPEWETFVPHAETIIRYTETMTQLMIGMFMIPVPQQLTAQLDLLADRFADRLSAAATYRIGLFAVAVVLLAFSTFKALQVRRYYHMLGQANDELEDRVAERTRELSDANRALQSEVRERRTVESQLRMAQKLESIGALAAGIAHEINTPSQYVSDNVAFAATAWRDLTPLLEEYERTMNGGGVDTSRSLAIWKQADVEYLRAEVPAALGAATAGLSQIERIVRAIKDFSHPGDDTLQPEDLNAAIENSVTVASNEWKYIAELGLDLDPALPKVPCNVSAFNQVILNLIVNSAQAIEAERATGRLGRIRISTRLAGDHAEIVVEDDGPGVPESIRHQIFDPFFTTKEVGKGSGQGLAIAFRVITKQHGGTMAVGTASAGRGARFTMHLPLTQPEQATPLVGRAEDLADTIRSLKLRARA